MADDDQHNEGSNDSTGSTSAGGDGAGNSSTGNHEGYNQLGDPGKRAYDAMKAEKQAMKAELDALKAQHSASSAQNASTDRNGDTEGNTTNSSEPSKSADEIRDEVSKEITAANNQRILRSDVKAVAKDYLANASDALVFLDLSDMQPDSNGDFDEAAIKTKLDALVTERPYLAKPATNQFQGSADTGPKGNGTKGQLSQNDLKKMSSSEIMAAYREGRLTDMTKRS